jgi:predicted MFS family arabinose efflux permease
MVYPFLPQISRGVGVSEATLSDAISARASVGILSPILGAIADRWGRKVTMLIGLALFLTGMVLVFVWPSYPALFIALLLTSLSKILFDPATYAYLGDRVDYRKRGLAVGITEFGWSGAFLIGVPVAGWLIQRSGWSSPFPILALIITGIMVWLWRAIPNDRPQAHQRVSLRSGFEAILKNRPALAGLIMGFLISGSNEVINVVYGVWMEDAFALQVTALGLTAIVIGIAELLGEGLVAGFVDRVGKRRAVAIGLVLYAVTSLLLPIIGGTRDGALVGLFLFYLAFEFTLVSTLPLMTELLPTARATLMATNAATHFLGRMVAALIGSRLYLGFGLAANGIVTAIMVLSALVVLLFFVKEHAQVTISVDTDT